MGEGER